MQQMAAVALQHDDASQSDADLAAADLAAAETERQAASTTSAGTSAMLRLLCMETSCAAREIDTAGGIGACRCAVGNFFCHCTGAGSYEDRGVARCGAVGPVRRLSHGRSAARRIGQQT